MASVFNDIFDSCLGGRCGLKLSKTFIITTTIITTLLVSLVISGGYNISFHGEFSVPLFSVSCGFSVHLLDMGLGDIYVDLDPRVTSAGGQDFLRWNGTPPLSLQPEMLYLADGGSSEEHHVWAVGGLQQD